MRGSKTNKCVECGSHVPEYQTYLCEACWKIALVEKLDDEKKMAEVRDINIDSSENEWF
jgi:DNA-directed RNA polymerase subunit RPC12/RpoP